MTYEEAINPANASPFDDTFVWSFIKMVHFANGDAVQTIIVPLDEPQWFQLCNVYEYTTDRSLQIRLYGHPYAVGARDYYSGNNWECGTLEELISSAARWRKPYDV